MRLSGDCGGELRGLDDSDVIWGGDGVTVRVTAKIEVPCGSATRVAKVIEFQANGGCGVVCGGRGYALGS